MPPTPSALPSAAPEHYSPSPALLRTACLCALIPLSGGFLILLFYWLFQWTNFLLDEFYSC